MSQRLLEKNPINDTIKCSDQKIFIFHTTIDVLTYCSEIVWGQNVHSDSKEKNMLAKIAQFPSFIIRIVAFDAVKTSKWELRRNFQLPTSPFSCLKCLKQPNRISSWTG